VGEKRFEARGLYEKERGLAKVIRTSRTPGRHGEGLFIKHFKRKKKRGKDEGLDAIAHTLLHFGKGGGLARNFFGSLGAPGKKGG